MVAPDDSPLTATNVLAANSLPPQAFHIRHVAPSVDAAKLPTGYRIETESSSSISKADFESCFRLIEETSKAAYRAARAGWSIEGKKSEMQDKDMRFLLLRAPPSSLLSPEDSNGLAGFLQFMLTPEEDFFVIYCYEVHIMPSMQGHGLGTCLMRLLEAVGQSTGVQKAMLTVFTTNEAGLRFYQRHGYEWWDEEPVPAPKRLRGGKTKAVKPDYFIFAKDL